MGIGDRLKTARTRVDMTIAEVASVTGLGESSISEFENGKRDPKINQLARLASVYRRSMSFFFDESDTEGSGVLWRLKPEVEAPVLERKFLKLCEQYRLLEMWNNQIIVPTLPTLQSNTTQLDYAEVEDLARNVVNELNLGERPSFVLPRVLEEYCGIKIFCLQFEPTGTAACVKSEELGWAVLLNSRNSVSRRNFDLAHELFHLLTWDLFYVQNAGIAATPPDKQERLADYFASCILIPAEPLKRAVGTKRNTDGSIPVLEIPDIASQFGVSVDALMWRIHWVYNFGKSRVGETKANIEASRKASYRGGLIEDSLEIPRLPKRYRTLATHALWNSEMSIGKFAEFMQISRRDAMAYLESEEQIVGEVRLTPA